jgi:hypothetical protein
MTALGWAWRNWKSEALNITYDPNQKQTFPVFQMWWVSYLDSSFVDSAEVTIWVQSAHDLAWSSRCRTLCLVLGSWSRLLAGEPLLSSIWCVFHSQVTEPPLPGVSRKGGKCSVWKLLLFRSGNAIHCFISPPSGLVNSTPLQWATSHSQWTQTLEESRFCWGSMKSTCHSQ